MWVLKYKGETHYVNHVSFNNVSFETKETPDNPHTKGALKFKNVNIFTKNIDGKVSVIISS